MNFNMSFNVIDIFSNILQQFSFFINFFANFVIDCHFNFSIVHLVKIKLKHNTMFTDDTTQINESISMLLIQFISYHCEKVKVCATAQAHVNRSISLWDNNRMSNLIQPLNFPYQFCFSFQIFSFHFCWMRLWHNLAAFLFVSGQSKAYDFNILWNQTKN